MNKYIVAGICLAVIFIASFFRVSVLTYISERTGNIIAKEDSAKLVFTGDVMLGRTVANIIKSKGENYLFASTTELFSSADSVIVNLEGPVMSDYKPTPAMGMSFSFASNTARLLKNNGINIAFLANNHLYDYGNAGFLETRKYLDDAKVAHFGHPFSTSTDYVLKTEINGQKITFVGYNFTNPNFPKKSAIETVKKIKEKDSYLIVMVHGGEEYQLVSNTAQKSLYRNFVDAGADAVIAHHPHVTQDIELYSGKPIFYSLGNFIFDQYFSKDVQEGLVLKLDLGPVVAKYDLIPIKIEKSRPRPMDSEGKYKFLVDLSKRSNDSAKVAFAAGEIVIIR